MAPAYRDRNLRQTNSRTVRHASARSMSMTAVGRAALCFLALFGADARADVEEARANDIRVAAGRLHRGELRLELEARNARWFPETREGRGFEIQVFAE